MEFADVFKLHLLRNPTGFNNAAQQGVQMTTVFFCKPCALRDGSETRTYVLLADL